MEDEDSKSTLLHYPPMVVLYVHPRVHSITSYTYSWTHVFTNTLQTLAFTSAPPSLVLATYLGVHFFTSSMYHLKNVFINNLQILDISKLQRHQLLGTFMFPSFDKHFFWISSFKCESCQLGKCFLSFYS